MGLFTCVARLVVFITSAVLLVVSGVIVGFTIYLFADGTMMDVLQPLDETSLKIIIYAMFAFSILVFFISAFGILAVCCSSECSAKIYIILQFVTVIGFAACCIMMIVKRTTIESDIKTKMDKTFINYQGELNFKDDKDTDTVNMFMFLLDTCGNNGSDGFQNTPWKKNPEDGKTIKSLFGNGKISGSYDFPFLCCKDASSHFTYSKLRSGDVTAETIEANTDQFEFLKTCYQEDNKKNTETIQNVVPDMIKKATLMCILCSAGVAICGMILMASAFILLKSGLPE